MNDQPAELSHPLRVDAIGHATISVSLRPGADVRAAIAKRFDLQGVERFEADLRVRRRRDSGWIEVEGTLAAAVTQTCVATTDPVPADVAVEVLELFDDSGEVRPEEVDLDFTSDTPEPVDGEILDVGEIAAQAFGLALDPYPRTPGAEAVVTVAGEAGEPAPSPFGKLAALRPSDAKKG